MRTWGRMYGHGSEKGVKDFVGCNSKMEASLETNNAQAFIDFCIGSKGSHFDVAQVAYTILQHRHRYIGDNQWEVLRDGVWVPDVDRRDIVNALKIEVCQHFMERAMYWQEQSLSEEMSYKIDCQLRSYKLLEVCLKFSKDRFINHLIKECKSFFVVES